MGSTLKTMECSKELTDHQSEDRISDLPSHISTHILSLLPTKYAVATSILSTKWYESWTGITTLDFSDQLLQDAESSIDFPHVQAKFVSFVYWVLMLSTASCLDVFRLVCSQTYDGSHIHKWVAAVLRRQVKEISISICGNLSTSLPKKIFTCKTLVRLKLGRRFSLHIPFSVCLPCLKELYLYLVRLSDDGSIMRLLTGCPVLKKLAMTECIGKEVTVVNIAVPSLKWLIMNDLGYDEEVRRASRFRIVLDTPLLEDLLIVDYIAQGYEFLDRPENSKARISVTRQFGVLDYEIYRKALNDLLKGLSEVKLLGLKIEAFGFRFSDLPSFSNLKELEIGTCDVFTYEQLLNLLECSPVLETLTIAEGLQWQEESLDGMLELGQHEKVPNCLLHHLKAIIFENFGATDEEMLLVKFFLGTAAALETLNIVCDLEDKTVELFNELFVLPRASRICQIRIF